MVLGEKHGTNYLPYTMSQLEIEKDLNAGQNSII